jgi:transketolase
LKRTQLLASIAADRGSRTEYQNGVQPPQVHTRLAVEAGTGLGWREYVGSEGRVIARYDFGTSAPIKDLLKHFGFTPEHVASEARSLIAR